LGRARGGAFGGEVFVFSLFLGILNLIPLASFDGSRIATALLSLLFGEGAARAVSAVLSYTFLFLAWVVSVYVLFYSGANFALLLFCAYIFVFTVIKKDCNSRRKVV
jgi:membrane-associated protease RseP (regulator of RpoE activity)